MILNSETTICKLKTTNIKFDVFNGVFVNVVHREYCVIDIDNEESPFVKRRQ